MKVSVIIPVYNVERYLARCLDSVVGQTHRELEIVCVNDGSADSSREILARYAAADPRIVVLDRPNGGLSAARNTGLAAARGEWIAFVDSDDWIPPDAIELFVRAVTETGQSLAVSRAYAVDSLDAKPGRRLHVRVRRPALKCLVAGRKTRSSAWNKFYRADLLRNRRFIEGIAFEDWPFVTELFGDVDSYAEVAEPLYVYCRNAGAASIVRSPFDAKKAESYLVGIRHVAAHFADHPQRPAALRRLAMARRMLEKRAAKAGIALPPDPLRQSPGKRAEAVFQGLRAALGRFLVRRVWRQVVPRKIVFEQFHGNGFGCNMKYVALELLRRGGWELVWLANRPEAGGYPPGIRVVPRKSLAALRELATAGVWCANHNLGHFVGHCGLVKKPGQVYLQTWHGSFGIKCCRDVLSRTEQAMVDAVLTNGEAGTKHMLSCFGPRPAVLPTGYPRCDVLVSTPPGLRERVLGSLGLDPSLRLVLYAPTFRDDGDRKCYLTDFRPLAAALSARFGGTWKALLRLHPNLRKHGARFQAEGDVLDVSTYEDVQELMAAADAMISDYSSCVFDYVLTGRPAFLYAPDRAHYEAGRGLRYPLSETPYSVCESPEELVRAVRDFSAADFAEAERDYLRRLGSVERGTAAAQVADWLEGRAGINKEGEL